MAKLKTVEVVGPGGRTVINESDLETYLKKGYQVLDAVEPEADVPDEDEEPSDLRELFESHKIVDLKLFAKQAGIKGGDQMNKADLIEALVGSGYKPDDGE